MSSDAVVTSEESSRPSNFNSCSRIICRVCEKQFSQYTCPRCNIRYCSLPCYKSHSLRCTESFMRENVMEGLQQLQPGEESKSKMLDILKRFHEEEETESFGEEESNSSMSEETIQKILSGGTISLNDLSVEERINFQRAIASGELSKLIEPWDPWWLRPSAKYIALSSDGAQLVQPIMEEELGERDNDETSDELQEIPLGPESPLPPVSKLTASGPSPLLAIHLVDIIYSYCLTLRLYNGDWKADPLESATVVLSVSSVLDQSRQPETVLEVLSHCLEKTCSPAYKHMGGLQFGLRLIEDVIHLLDLGCNALICLLSDMQRLIQTAERELKLEKSLKSKKAEIKGKLKSAERKIYFIMCWVHDQPSEAWTSLAAILNTEKSSAMEYAHSIRSAPRMGEKTERGGKPLIKEIH
ncbi:HIT-type Zinc finger family protein [Perilla frutescens var. frutescens]|nr:HIT-type Zinc finger family protein [Perilla frutescens var. frutescens]